VIEVKVGGGAQDKDMYMNHRVELWGRMRDWLPNASLPNDKGLLDDLTAPMYEYSLKGQLKLEPKDKMKKRGHASPDSADALAMTFSRTIGRKDSSLTQRRRRGRVASGLDYEVLS
jgi:hypothetical protein